MMGGGDDPSCTGNVIELTLSSVSEVIIELSSVGVVGLVRSIISCSSDDMSGNVERGNAFSGLNFVGEPVSILDEGWILLLGRAGRRGVKS